MEIPKQTKNAESESLNLRQVKQFFRHSHCVFGEETYFISQIYSIAYN